MGPAGAGIFLREAQRVWPEVAPHLDDKALSGAERHGLPKDPDRLLKLAGETEPAVPAAALVRAALDKGTRRWPRTASAGPHDQGRDPAACHVSRLSAADTSVRTPGTTTDRSGANNGL